MAESVSGGLNGEIRKIKLHAGPTTGVWWKLVTLLALLATTLFLSLQKQQDKKIFMGFSGCKIFRFPQPAINHEKIISLTNHIVFAYFALNLSVVRLFKKNVFLNHIYSLISK